MKTDNKNKVLIWDFPTRVFHWLLLLSFATAWLTSESSLLLDLHLFAGYSFAGLLLFRLVWGFVGSHYARFRQFWYSHTTVISYLRSLLGLVNQGSPSQYYPGHNPAGSWAIYLILLLGLGLAIAGFATLGGQEQQGLLAGKLGFEAGAAFKELHELLANLLLLLVGVHVAGVLVESLLHRENLVRAMLSGYKPARGQTAPVKPYYALGSLLLLTLILSGGWYVAPYFKASTQQPYLPFKGPQLSMNSSWQENCSECHLAYHPSLLPARSWQQLLTQDNHFGEDLALEPELTQELLSYAKANAADQPKTEAAWRINRSIPSTQTPLRITTTEFWKHQHEEMPKAVWQRDEVKSRANCDACHLDAKSAGFQAGAIKIPGQSWWDSLLMDD